MKVRHWTYLVIIFILTNLAGFYWSTNTISDFSLENFSYAATIVTAFSVVLAIIGLQEDREQRKYQKEQDQALLVAQQVRMFRLEILPILYDLGEDMKKIADKTGTKYPAIENINEFSIRWLLGNRTRDALIQHLFWNAAHERFTEFGLDSKWGDRHQALLNALEELSIQIWASGTIKNQKLTSIHKTYVYCIEILIWPLLLTAPYDKSMYPAIKFIYSEWSSDIDRTPNEDIKKQVAIDIQAAADALRAVMTHEEYEKLRFPPGKK